MKKFFFALTVHGFIGSVSAVPLPEENDGFSTPPRHAPSPGPAIEEPAIEEPAIDEAFEWVEGVSLFTGEQILLQILNLPNNTPSIAVGSPSGVWELAPQIHFNHPTAAAISEIHANNTPDQEAFESSRRVPPQNNPQSKRRRL